MHRNTEYRPITAQKTIWVLNGRLTNHKPAYILSVVSKNTKKHNNIGIIVVQKLRNDIYQNKLAEYIK